ncbi:MULTISPECIES: M23 family metallopeptidase [unclassified Amycolatopsis]|uniref:M23 family metallopeptidase n=1 Tax=unclassified Amycolatopsis TaxID=2618356 RepID=UPI00106F0284|nr:MULTISPECIES: M23 family metallopeptidase [unclassified Amycolatopsis]
MGKMAAAGAGFVVVIMLFIGGGAIAVVQAVFGSSSSSASGSNCAPVGASATSAAGYGPQEMGNAATIVAVGKRMNVPEQGWVVAVAAALTESRLKNLNDGDRDSVGLFQQRPSQGWGTVAQIMDPAYSSEQFYRHLLALPNWQNMPVTVAAQTVQRSGFPDRYAKFEPAARQIVGTTPTSGTCTSRFGYRGNELHKGLDIAAPIGTPILAANSGTVISSGPASGYGLWVRIQHGDGIVTIYGHNDHNLVREGQSVRAGEPIAAVGNRGASTGAHLHLQIEANGQAVDPVEFYRQRGGQLCG